MEDKDTDVPPRKMSKLEHHHGSDSTDEGSASDDLLPSTALAERSHLPALSQVASITLESSGRRHVNIGSAAFHRTSGAGKK